MGAEAPASSTIRRHRRVGAGLGPCDLYRRSITCVFGKKLDQANQKAGETATLSSLWPRRRPAVHRPVPRSQVEPLESVTSPVAGSLTSSIASSPTRVANARTPPSRPRENTNGKPPRSSAIKSASSKRHPSEQPLRTRSWRRTPGSCRHMVSQPLPSSQARSLWSIEIALVARAVEDLHGSLSLTSYFPEAGHGLGPANAL